MITLTRNYLNSIEDLQGLKVMVYRNLHKGAFSVKALEGEHKGRVVAHADSIFLADCQFKVSEAGRQRVIKEQKKNVHAGLVGYVYSPKKATVKLKEAYYNPYKTANFQDAITGEALTKKPRVMASHNKIFYSY